MRPFLRLLALTLLGACSSLGFEAEVSNKTPLAPLEVYASWWAATEACSDLQGDMERITWYTATGITGDGKLASGRWSEPHDIILVLGYEETERIVRHEMLHDLLGGDPDHTASAWQRCDLLVD